jgi:hypothetical protein
MESPVRESFYGPRIGGVFIGSKDDPIAGTNDAAKQLFYLSLSGLGIRSSKSLFEDPPLESLSRPHRAAAPQLDVVEPVDEV